MKISAVIICICMFIACFQICVHGNEAVAAGEVVIAVKGLVCEFCVKTIEKVLRKQDEVADVSIDLRTATVKVMFKKGQTIDDARIKALIKDAGYDVDTINRLNKEG